ncbi:MAG: DUF2974 domain-containing protein [Anaerolineaceae bacterium]|nr:DUF2974 domain-containing protein [Chloroflexota bacterium]
MPNILDYLDWRGDLEFQRDPLNEVDNLVFSVLSYMDFAGAVPTLEEAGSVSLADAAETLKQMPEQITAPITSTFFSRLPVLLEKCAGSARYRDVRLSHYVNRVSFDEAEQFSALVFSTDDTTHFVAFSGTDDTLVGWKEDLEMSFRDVVPAQRSAVEYLELVMSHLPGVFYLGGHSKGGNLAVFAGANISSEMQPSILLMYNNDGPGFQRAVIESPGYQRVANKILTFLPKSSVVGMLLNQSGHYHVVDSDETGFMQHNAFSWEVIGRTFVYQEGLSTASLKFNSALREWLDTVSLEEREDFVTVLFTILEATGARTLKDFTQDKLTNAKAMIATFKQLEPETQGLMKSLLETFFSEIQKVLRSSITESISSLITRTFARKRLPS